MLQTILILALVIETAIYIFLAYRWWEEPLSLLFIVPLILCIVVVVRIMIALPSYWLSGALRYRDKNQQPWGNSLYALAKEIDARAMMFGLTEPFHQWVMPKKTENALQYKDKPCVPVLLVHGYFSNRGIFWQLRKRLLAAAIGPVYTVNLEPLLGGIDSMVPVLGRRIEQVCKQANASQVIIVAHSMGGLVTRRYMANSMATAVTTAVATAVTTTMATTVATAVVTTTAITLPMPHEGVNETPMRVKRFITLGSPHHGSEMSGFSIGQCVREMRLASPWLSALEQAEAGMEHPPTLSIYTLNDDLIYPPESSKLDWAHNIPVAAVGHVSMLFSKPIAERIIAEIRK